MPIGRRSTPRRKVHPIQPPWMAEQALALRAKTRQERQLEADGRQYMAYVAEQRCALLYNYGSECSGRTTVAHRDGAGMALRSSDFETFACCEGHHLRGPNSIAQMGVKAWESKYGPQSFYIWQTRYRIRLAHDISHLALRYGLEVP